MDGFLSWSKGADCKSVAIASKVRILPHPLPTKIGKLAQIAQMVERRAEDPRVGGSIPSLSMLIGM